MCAVDNKKQIFKLHVLKDVRNVSNCLFDTCVIDVKLDTCCIHVRYKIERERERERERKRENIHKDECP